MLGNVVKGIWYVYFMLLKQFNLKSFIIKLPSTEQNSKPSGVSPIDADFAEFPWQAMIARDSTRTLLCGGVIIRNDVVLTTSKCLEG